MPGHEGVRLVEHRRHAHVYATGWSGSAAGASVRPSSCVNVTAGEPVIIVQRGYISGTRTARRFAARGSAAKIISNKNAVRLMRAG